MSLKNEQDYWFCTACFSSSEDDIGPDSVGVNCHSCGGTNGMIHIPKWAILRIRENSSWLGKRYWPHKEDKRVKKMLKRLRIKLDW